MIFSAEEIKDWSISQSTDGRRYIMSRPLWCRWGRWKHAWWVLTGRCDAIWWPADGNPCLASAPQRVSKP